MYISHACMLLRFNGINCLDKSCVYTSFYNYMGPLPILHSEENREFPRNLKPRHILNENCEIIGNRISFSFLRSDDDDTDKDGGNSISSASPLPVHEIIEHIVKSPPEPTRVKSPEQIIMRSPDPVNWTVPLDTGKTFTVTQNVRDGMLGS